MASVAVRCGGGGVTCSPLREWRNRSKNRNATSAMTIGGGRKEATTMMMMMNPIWSALSTAETGASRLETRRGKRRQEESVSRENVIDEWMRDSVVEIVKNLREAPLLVHVYSGGDGSARRLRTEKAAEENWLTMKNEWENETAPKPEGLIFVEQLREDGGVVEEEEEESSTSTDFGGASEITRAWGVVVQGRGQNCGPACYLLKTTRAGAGLGLCCTHFCLVKVKSFRETAETQFKNCWLLNGK